MTSLTVLAEAPPPLPRCCFPPFCFMSTSLTRVQVLVQGVPMRAGSIPQTMRGTKSRRAAVDSATVVAREHGEPTVERTTVEVAIIGAGVAGLEAARLLHEANVDVAILEARER